MWNFLLISWYLDNSSTYIRLIMFSLFTRGILHLAKVCLEFTELCRCLLCDVVEVWRWRSSRRFDWIASVWKRCTWHNRLNPGTSRCCQTQLRKFYDIEYQLTSSSRQKVHNNFIHPRKLSFANEILVLTTPWELHPRVNEINLEI